MAKITSKNLSITIILPLLLLTFKICFAIPPNTKPFAPRDNYLISCGAPGSFQLDDGRTFRSDPETSSYLATTTDIKISADNPPHSSSTPLPPIYLTARVFTDKSSYSFFIAEPGRHWVRLHFFPLPNNHYNLTSAAFSVNVDSIALLHGFSLPGIPPSPVIKEYIVNAQGNSMKLSFLPQKGSVAFINAIEVVSMPPNLIPNTTNGVGPGSSDKIDLSNNALQVMYRLNMGGALITPFNDTLSRYWVPDSEFLKLSDAASAVWAPTNTIKYSDDNPIAQLIAPVTVYSTAQQMGSANTSSSRFNITWVLNAEPGFSYFVRLHFCDIVSKVLNSLYFNVYLNGLMGVSNMDLSTITMGLGVTYYKDFVLDSSSVVNSTILVQVGPANIDSGNPNAILNGLEVMKISNPANSLDGLYSAPKTTNSKAKLVVSAIGLAMAIIAIALVFTMFYRKRCDQTPKWERKNSYSSWLLPLNASQSSFMSGYSKGNSRSRFGSTSKNGFSSVFMSGTYSVGRVFTFLEIQKATHNFDEKFVIGVGGFGKVYLGELEDGTKLAIKRGNQNSDQGINEFLTEIQMLSKLRHRHLVSLIGCCDEKNEMILVYEYMSNGTLREHLYVGNGGAESETGLPVLTWKKRLEICIGAAKGLHYLHTGASQGIIHRDIKTTNILLDENLVAKVADFGLSKDAPSLEQTHVSTAVKGSFGYLDPEYFRRQQLTEKSDVYSFGVVLFEVLCCRPAINPALPRDQVNLAEWAIQWNKKGQLDKIIDPKIAGTIAKESLNKFVDAAQKCLAEYGVDRPSMGDVLWKLESALQLQQANQNNDNNIINVDNNKGGSSGSNSNNDGGFVEIPLKEMKTQKSGLLMGFDSFNDRSEARIPPPLDQGR